MAPYDMQIGLGIGAILGIGIGMLIIIVIGEGNLNVKQRINKKVPRNSFNAAPVTSIKPKV